MTLPSWLGIIQACFSTKQHLVLSIPSLLCVRVCELPGFLVLLSTRPIVSLTHSPPGDVGFLVVPMLAQVRQTQELAQGHASNWMLV